MSGEFGRVTVIVLEKVSVYRHVGPPVNDAGERAAVRPVAGALVAVRDFAAVRRLGHVHRRGVHLVGQHRGERAVLSDVRRAAAAATAVVQHAHHRRRPVVDHEPQRKRLEVFHPRTEHARYPFQRPQRHVRERPVVADHRVVHERIENFDHRRSHHDHSSAGVEKNKTKKNNFFFKISQNLLVFEDGKIYRAKWSEL